MEGQQLSVSGLQPPVPLARGRVWSSMAEGAMSWSQATATKEASARSAARCATSSLGTLQVRSLPVGRLALYLAGCLTVLIKLIDWIWFQLHLLIFLFHSLMDFSFKFLI